MNQKVLSISLPVNLFASTQILIFSCISILSFAIPFSLGHPQWLVGIIVNACLFLSATFLPRKFLLPLIIFPSLGVLARGIIFGPFTSFLIYFLPFIWLANLVLVLVFKNAILIYKSHTNDTNFNIKYVASVVISSVAKFIFLLTIADIYFKFSFVPKIFLQTMGVVQLLTALAGGLISWLIFDIYGRYNVRNKRVI